MLAEADDDAPVTTQRLPPTSTWRSGLWLLDAVALLLALVGGTLLVLTLDPAWTLLTVLACAVVALGSGHRGWLTGVLTVGGASWLVALAREVVETASWPPSLYLDWGRALGALVAAVALAIVTSRTRHHARLEVDQARAFAEDATVRDPLTGLANRKGLAMLGGQILESSRRRGDAVYCMFLDVDGLAKVNTELGHACGDEVLLTVAEALSGSTRATDVVARWGDDEFVVVGPGTGLAPLEMERRVRARCLESAPVPRSTWSARISAGGAVLEPWDDGDVDTLLRQADREMHLRRTLRREAAAPPYQPTRHDPSPRPPESRH